MQGLRRSVKSLFNGKRFLQPEDLIGDGFYQYDLPRDCRANSHVRAKGQARLALHLPSVVTFASRSFILDY